LSKFSINQKKLKSLTLSCGTGSVACTVLAQRLGKTDNTVKVNTKGGELRITIAQDATYMEGTAERVFEGKVI
jgi:diaminopimelate epimerase